MHDLEALAQVVQKRAETAMRRAIAALPDGRYEHRVEADGLDTHLSFPIRIEIAGDEIEVGFEGSPPQMEQGGSNCTLTYTMAHATYPLKCILSPEVPGNAGCYRPMKVTAPEKSIMNCDRPLAVNMRTRTGWYIAPNVFGALAEAASGRVQGVHGPAVERALLRESPGRHLLQRPPVPGAGARVPPSGATGIPRSCTPRARATPRWSSSRAGSPRSSSRRHSSPTAAGRGGSGAGSDR